MKKLLHYLLEQARRYTILDFFFFKLTLVSIGLLLGTYLSFFFQKYIPFIWIVFAISYLFTMFATFRKRK